MRYLSVCSGIEAATVAWHGLGWQPVGFSEIEPFPSAVLAHHYPEVPNLGDMTKYKEWDIGAIDLVVGGTPCQSFSVAGLRKGLEDPRGNLALVYCGILDHFKPRWFVWENVPGVLSSNGGRDFGSFLGALAELGYGFAYRVLDAQFFGVAQRRRRVFVVGHLGDWEPAAKVLFEPSCLSGNPKPSREKGKEVAGRVTHGLGVGGECARALTAAHTATGRLDPHEATFISQMEPVGIPEVMSTLLSSTAGISRPGNAATEHETYIPMCFQQNTRDEVRYIGGDGQIAGALAAEAGMKQQNYIQQPISIHPHCIGRAPEAGPQGKEYLTDGTAYCMDSRGQPQAVAQPVNIYGGNKRPDRPEGGFYVRMDEETSKTLDAASGLNPTCSQGGTAVMQPIAVDVYNQAIDGQTAATLTEACGGTNTSGPKVMQPMSGCLTPELPQRVRVHGVDGTSPTLSAEHGRGHGVPTVLQPVVYDTTNITSPQNGSNPQPGDPCFTLAKGQHPPLLTSMAVRRLTPKECERLQGFPDNYTEIPWRGKTDTPDGPRYKALGNSMAVPVMRWIGEKINTRRAA